MARVRGLAGRTATQRSRIVTAVLKYKRRETTTRVILHDSHTRPDVCHTEDVPRWAVLAHEGGLRMGILSIGYHYIVERDGTVVPCRERELIGSHTPGHNMDSIGVCLVGGREEEGGDGVDNFTQEQRNALLSLLHELRQAYPGIKLKGHSEVQRFRHRDHPPCPPLDMDLLREDLDLYAQGLRL
ncbi:N-acetylmuramoyl-L-alanine amidase [Neorhizobium galegae]|nr:N-acetylmuramoyl-L-alanine amidase [Neorhizobium galegae]